MTMPRSLSVWPQNIRFSHGAKTRPDSERYAKNHANITMPPSLSVNPKAFAFGAVQKRDL